MTVQLGDGWDLGQSQHLRSMCTGGGKNGDPSSSFLQVLQKLYRRQYLEQKIKSEKNDTRGAYNVFIGAYREREGKREDVARH
jgi:hypothetical protein